MKQIYILKEKSNKEQMIHIKENPYGWKKKYPGPTEESLSCPLIGSLSGTLRWR